MGMGVSVVRSLAPRSSGILLGLLAPHAAPVGSRVLWGHGLTSTLIPCTHRLALGGDGRAQGTRDTPKNAICPPSNLLELSSSPSGY